MILSNRLLTVKVRPLDRSSVERLFLSRLVS
nr:MAG TPA: hypothetical protein [Caudoviricetes sp.]